MDKFFYKTIQWVNQYEIPKIKWSRFIINSFFVSNKQEAEQYIIQTQKKYHDATHNCYAYRYGTKINFDLFWNLEITPEHTKQSDDWEPTNTAGKPILSVIQWADLHNILIIVTRYFWWTMLGVWWLIQAYTSATQWLIQNSNISFIEISDTLQFSYKVEYTSLVMNIINKYHVKIKNQNFVNEKNKIVLEINKAYISWFKNDIFQGSKWVLKI